MELVQWLEDKGISQRQFANKVEISPVTLNRIIKKVNLPRLEIAFKIQQETYGMVTCEDLLGKNSKKNDKKKQKGRK